MFRFYFYFLKVDYMYTAILDCKIVLYDWSSSLLESVNRSKDWKLISKTVYTKTEKYVMYCIILTVLTSTKYLVWYESVFVFFNLSHLREINICKGMV